MQTNYLIIFGDLRGKDADFLLWIRNNYCNIIPGSSVWRFLAYDSFSGRRFYSFGYDGEISRDTIIRALESFGRQADIQVFRELTN
ncbi:MAG: hypothetical protein COY38_01620 [Candidatus Aenigmarchaeota archaeon CG_4_10_14_0_8_um_filter_37_24]|nr:hypothetical protein [Candidatus Aenigmarchaeota archaeon]OIN88680.1 MAG: hypothetical protein AUJ50_00205 [Candidatus Aenigmarchaeota archaeon CG1_02_38_14]PIV68058.1 MAG: hypothetical protein COS07_05330 [Candidatus Aenigmarchaeota archaeon CG01_land_8_20_14_3_00_37_9]PIW41282.1 MAG: hypothetical protein COW21_02770 [Candidatus Aenigmarchaeota archaeon CG15_BIG_FIL_POST_REV_8_21_14_020_37_27]PIX50591.1 MAG: hypothetical protein COZ52_03180 [Candidatus Aenigmarchaeota archaeon CG_4_8_14_3_u